MKKEWEKAFYKYAKKHLPLWGKDSYKACGFLSIWLAACEYSEINKTSCCDEIIGGKRAREALKKLK